MVLFRRQFLPGGCRPSTSAALFSWDMNPFAKNLCNPETDTPPCQLRISGSMRLTAAVGDLTPRTDFMKVDWTGASRRSSVARVRKRPCWVGPKDLISDFEARFSVLSRARATSALLMVVMSVCATAVRAVSSSVVDDSVAPRAGNPGSPVPPDRTFPRMSSHWWFNWGLSGRSVKETVPTSLRETAHR